MNVAGETRRPAQYSRLKIVPLVATMALGGCSGQGQNFVTGPDGCGPWELHAGLSAEEVMEQGVQVPGSGGNTVMVKFGRLAAAMAVAKVDKDGNVSIAPIWYGPEEGDYNFAMSLEAGTWVAGIVVGFNGEPDQVMATTVGAYESTLPPPLTCQELA